MWKVIQKPWLMTDFHSYDGSWCDFSENKHLHHSPMLMQWKSNNLGLNPRQKKSVCVCVLSCLYICQWWHWFSVDKMTKHKILFLLQKLRCCKSGKREGGGWFIISNTPTYSLTVQISLSLTCIHIGFHSMYFFWLQLNKLNQATEQYLSLLMLWKREKQSLI